MIISSIEHIFIERDNKGLYDNITLYINFSDQVFEFTGKMPAYFGEAWVLEEFSDSLVLLIDNTLSYPENENVRVINEFSSVT